MTFLWPDRYFDDYLGARDSQCCAILLKESVALLQASVTCAATGPVRIKDVSRISSSDGGEVFSEQKGLNFFQNKVRLSHPGACPVFTCQGPHDVLNRINTAWACHARSAWL